MKVSTCVRLVVLALAPSIWAIPEQLATEYNTATRPAAKLENDFYDWNTRHQEVCAIQKTINPNIVLIGDSITHLWGGEPRDKHCRGTQAFEEAFKGYRVLNMGFGWDRTQNVLWRLEHGEMDGLTPDLAVLLIGTNNTSGTPNARNNTPAEIAEGVRAICDKVQAKSPKTKIVIMAVFPRGEKPNTGSRKLVDEINANIKPIANGKDRIFLDIGPQFLSADGTISREVMGDFLHPTNKGYAIWGAALKPYLPPKK